MEMAPPPINSDEKISEKEGEREKLLAVTHTRTSFFVIDRREWRDKNVLVINIFGKRKYSIVQLL